MIINKCDMCKKEVSEFNSKEKGYFQLILFNNDEKNNGRWIDLCDLCHENVKELFSKDD